jgi:hypothetical protein
MLSIPAGLTNEHGTAAYSTSSLKAAIPLPPTFQPFPTPNQIVYKASYVPPRPSPILYQTKKHRPIRAAAEASIR